MTDGEIFYKITTGKRPMPAMQRKMDDTERWNVVLYLRSMQGELKTQASRTMKALKTAYGHCRARARVGCQETRSRESKQATPETKHPITSSSQLLPLVLEKVDGSGAFSLAAQKGKVVLVDLVGDVVCALHRGDPTPPSDVG